MSAANLCVKLLTSKLKVLELYMTHYRGKFKCTKFFNKANKTVDQ